MTVKKNSRPKRLKPQGNNSKLKLKTLGLCKFWRKLQRDQNASGKLQKNHIQGQSIKEWLQLLNKNIFFESFKHFLKIKGGETL